MDGCPSGQRGQTVNLLSTTSKVRILLHPFGYGRSQKRRIAHDPVMMADMKVKKVLDIEFIII